MKKAGLVFCILFASIFLIALSSAETIPTDALTDQVKNINDKLDNIPTDPKDITDIQHSYLKEEWNNILSNNSVLGPFHNYFIAHPLIFKILFKEKYSFSLTFMLTVLLWVFIFILVYNLAKSKYPAYKSLLTGLLSSLLFTYTTMLAMFVSSLLKLVYSQDMWWGRLIIWLIFAAILFIIFRADHMISQEIRKTLAANKRAELEQKANKANAFIEGVEKGQEIKESIQGKKPQLS